MKDSLKIAIAGATGYVGLELIKILIKHPKIVIASDDIYEKIYWGKTSFQTIATVSPDLNNQIVTINGVSKCYAMTGWRIGYAGGPKNIINAMKTIQSQSTSNPCSISQIAAIAALDGNQDCVKTMNDEYKIRNDYIVKALNEIPGFECRYGEGSFYAFPNICGTGMTSDEYSRKLLHDSGVCVLSGNCFGKFGEGYVRKVSSI